jgi:hypothetical protein
MGHGGLFLIRNNARLAAEPKTSFMGLKAHAPSVISDLQLQY